MCNSCNEFMGRFKFCPHCGSELKEQTQTEENIWTYLSSLDKPDTYEKWRYAGDIMMKYHRNGKDVEDKEVFEEIKNAVQKEFKI